MQSTTAFLFVLPVMRTSENNMLRALGSRIPSQYVVFAPLATSAATPGNILEIEILEFQTRPTKIRNSGVRPSHLCFKNSSGDTGAHKELFENRYLKPKLLKQQFSYT